MKFLMVKRRGVSLLNVMVFMVFAVMLTAQVFFFAKNAVDEVADEREMMMYRMNLDSLLEEGKAALRLPSNDRDGIKHYNGEEPTLTFETKEGEDKTFEQFDEYTKAKKSNNKDKDWELPTMSDWKNKYDDTYDIRIYDLDYILNYSGHFPGSSEWQKTTGENMYKKVFAAMNPPVVSDDATYITKDGKKVPDIKKRRYYLIRAWAQLPENFYGRKLMYQVLVRRDNEDSDTAKHKVETLSFQEVWF